MDEFDLSVQEWVTAMTKGRAFPHMSYMNGPSDFGSVLGHREEPLQFVI